MGYYGFIQRPRVLAQAALLRQCSSCKGEYPNTDEYFYRRTKFWHLEGQCKACRRAAAREWKRHHPRQQARPASYGRRKSQEYRDRQLAKAGYPVAPRHYWGSLRASVELGVRQETLSLWAKGGRVPAVRHGKTRWRFDPATIRALAREREGRANREPRTAGLARRKWGQRDDALAAAD